MRIRGTVMRDRRVFVMNAIVAVRSPFRYCSAIATTVAAGDIDIAMTGAR